MRQFTQCEWRASLRRYSPLFGALVLALIGAAILWVPGAQAASPVAVGIAQVEPAEQLAPMASPGVVLTVAPEPTVYGQSFTMTATVQSITGTMTLPAPTGSVTFLDGATPLSTTILFASGVDTYTVVATYITNSLNIGSHTLMAVYSGDGIYDGTNSLPLNHTVNQAATTAVVVPSSNPSVRGQSVTIEATVLPQAPGGGTPDGNVTIKDGATALNPPITLVNGTATFVTSDLILGDHPLTVDYSGSAAFTASSSEVVTLTVNKADTAILAESQPSPSVFGQEITITATVVVTAPGSGVPTGIVTFTDSSTVIGTGTLVNGVVTMTTTAFSVGVHVVGVEYSGDSDFNPSPEVLFLHTVELAESATTITAGDPNPSIFTDPVFFTVTVTAVLPGAGVPTGTVNILDGPTVVATGTAISGVAVVSVTALTIGTHPTITALYQGNDEFLGSSSTAVEQVVVRQPTQVTVDASANTVQVGLRVTLTATVSSTYGIPSTGTVTFFDGTTVLGTMPIVSGVATLSTLGLGTGTHSITAAYSGDATFAPSSSPEKVVTIDLRFTSTQLGSSPNPSNLGRPVTFVALVSPSTAPSALQAAGVAAMPTGQVLFVDETGTLSATAPLVSGIARLATSALPAGIYSVTAQYSGDSAYAPSVSQVVLQEVLDMVFATNDAAGTAFQTPVTINVLANDTGTGLTVSDAGDPTGGTVVINPDFTVTFTPDPGFTGLGTFTYVARDSYGNVDQALATIIVGVPVGTDTQPLIGVIGPTGPQTITFVAPGATTFIQLPLGTTDAMDDKDIMYLGFASLITPTQSAPAGQQYAGFSFVLEAFLNNVMIPGFQFSPPAIITIDYDPAVLGNVLPSTLSVRYWNGSAWSTDGITLVSHDVANHRIVFQLAHLSQFAFFAQPRIEMYLPIVAR